MAHERASEGVQKTKHAQEKKKGTGDSERASQQRREKRLRKSVFQNGRESQLKWMCFGGTYSCICTSTFIQIRPTKSRQEGYCCV
jgi:hypothetical protein